MRHRPFALFWSARVMSSVAFQMMSVAIGWQVYSITHSAYALGLVGLAQFVPMCVLTLVVGHVADRYDRRTIAFVCQLLQGLAALALCVGAWHGLRSPALIYAIATITGASRAFESPSMAALLPNLVPRTQLQHATAWSTSANQTAQILGPAMGGLLYGLGPSNVYGLVACAFVAAAAFVASIRIDEAVRMRAPLSFESLFSGIAFIRKKPVILGALSLDLFAVLLGGATALLPVFAHDILHTGPWALGVMRAAPAAGALAGSIWLAHFPLKQRAGTALFGGVIAFGIATVLFGLSRNLVVSLVALAALGASDVISVVVRTSLVQLQTPDEMRGRVGAINSLFIGTSNQLGEFESGMTAGLFGAVPAVLIGGIGTIAVALLWMRLFPALRATRSLEG
ncbi:MULTISPECIES: MFS transporter [unclassified Caballeronia]|uniref:MFS transporter n=1 Tax=unclassified Caballeronia TaxID=2646786 RepID=UPI0028625A19|nr:MULTISPECIES: MFS transporter [unclassified Caballeronia]MDR5749882.1 MFS transporter [Caballeronia sp. LZ024]MDR5842990.1 MFS transporter [Caballeronia sp. LZ031]